MLTRRFSCSSWQGLAVLAVLVFLVPFSAYARHGDDGTQLDVRPGAKVMSAEEKAITADPEKGIEHAVILIEQTERDDTTSGGYRLKYHLRAKILSSEARSLGDITVPIYRETGNVRKFWAYVIKPDGSVKEIGKKGLKKQVVTESNRSKLTALKTALPEIEPGCVIDYGFDILVGIFLPPRPVALQRSWPVREVHYRWLPYPGWSAGYYTTKDDRVEVKRGKDKILVSAYDLPPRPDEPNMPPVREVGIYLYPYYARSSKAGAAYWNEVAGSTERTLKSFCGSKRKMDKLIAKMEMPASADLPGKLRYAYDWLLEKVTNKSLMTKDERAKWKIDLEDSRKKRSEVVDSALDVLDKGWGTPYQISLLYTGLARALGAEANLVRAVDRTQQYFKPALCSTEQFDSFFVEVTLPSPSGKVYFLDPGDGMPFGQIAWWLTGVTSLKSTPTGAKTLGAPLSRPAQNPVKTKTEITFIDDNEALDVNFSRRASGQAMLLTRRALRNMTPKEREKTLLEYCGNSGDYEVSSAETGDLTALSGDYELKCQGEAIVTGLDEDISTYSFRWDGVWLSALPDFDAGERKTAINFHYLYSKEDELHVVAPEGFEATEPPARINYDSSVLDYQLVVSKSPDGYIVVRKLVLKVPMIKREGYDQFVKLLVKLKQADETPLVFKKIGAQ